LTSVLSRCTASRWTSSTTLMLGYFARYPFTVSALRS